MMILWWYYDEVDDTDDADEADDADDAANGLWMQILY